jgi:hypothetical protein
MFGKGFEMSGVEMLEKRLNVKASHAEFFGEEFCR